MQTSIHIRLSDTHGKRFTAKLQEMGYSVTPNDKRSYYMMNPSDGRILIAEEPSSDIVIKQFTPKYGNAEIIELLEATARWAHGDMYYHGDDGTEISIIQGVDAPQPQAQVQQTTQAPQHPQAPQQAPQNQPTGNTDPWYYQKIIMDSMGTFMKMFALGHLKGEDVVTQGMRIQRAAWILAGIQENFLDAADIHQLMMETKQDLAGIPKDINDAKQQFQIMQTQQVNTAAQGITAPVQNAQQFATGIAQTPDPFATTQDNDPF